MPMQTERNNWRMATRVIAVTSGKGGVGKTNIAVNLAISLSQMGRRVVLWDLDLGLANVDILLNLRVAADLADVLDGRRTLAEIMIDGPGGIRVVPGASGDERLANIGERERALLVRGLEVLSADADYVIIDTGAGISSNTVRFAASADEVLVVTTPEPTSVLDAYSMIKLLSRQSPLCEIHILVNMARNRREAQTTLWRIVASVKNFIGGHLDEDGYVLYDPVVGDAVRRREPFVLMSPQSEAARAVRTIAELLDRSPPVNVSRRRAEEGGFLRRLLQFMAHPVG